MIFGFCPECGAVIQQDGSGHHQDCAIVTRVMQETIDLIGAPVSVPTEAGFDWGSITGQAHTVLRAPKVAPVPPAIIALAQKSYEGVEHPDHEEKLHVLRHQFESETRAAEFAKLMKKAGEHTTPKTTISVVIDPDYRDGGEKNPSLVAWRAGVRKGRK